MPDENGKKLQDIVVQGIAMALLAAMAGGGASFLRPIPPPEKDPLIAVLQEQVYQLRVELVNANVAASTERAQHRMEIGMLKGRVDLMGRLEMVRLGL